MITSILNSTIGFLCWISLPFILPMLFIGLVYGDCLAVPKRIIWPIRQRFLERECRKNYQGRRTEGEGYKGWKWALIRLDWDDKIEGVKGSFSPLRAKFLEEGYGTEDTARCKLNLYHDPPSQHSEDDKGCGFYALKLAKHLGKVPGSHKGQKPIYNRSVATLEVELFGTVFVDSLGFRAEKQRVLSVTFPNRCASCSGKPIGFDGPTTHYIDPNGKPWIIEVPCYAVPACVKHQKGKLLTASDLENMLGAEVKWKTAEVGHEKKSCSRFRGFPEVEEMVTEIEFF